MTRKELIREYYKERFPEMSLNELDYILSLTIKKDVPCKFATFFTFLSAYTEQNAICLSFYGKTCSGKTYIPNEISQLFPDDDVKFIYYCSPSAFLDLAKETKIIIFECDVDKLLLNEIIKYYASKEKNKPVIVFTTNVKLPSPLKKYTLCLYPENTQEKLEQSLSLKLKKKEDINFEKELENNQERQLLKQRIEIIKKLNIKKVEPPSDIVSDNYIFLSLLAGMTLLNFPYKDIEDSIIIPSFKDFKQICCLYDILQETEKGYKTYKKK